MLTQLNLLLKGRSLKFTVQWFDLVTYTFYLFFYNIHFYFFLLVARVATPYNLWCKKMLKGREEECQLGLQKA